MEHFEIILFFFFIALLYSSVGFGGGSSYLAVLALYGLDYNLLRITALLCNIIVVSGGVYWFWKRGHLKWKKIIPLVAMSVPLAFVGGRMQLTEEFFFILLGIALCLSGLMVFLIKTKSDTEEASTSRYGQTANAGLGGGIGLLSGMVGIGGGIFLAPVLHLMKWDKAKVIAATASFFILVNSMAGISGQLSRGIPDLNWRLIGFLLIAVFIGGQIGSRIGTGFLTNLIVRRLTAVLIFAVGLRILFKYF